MSSWHWQSWQWVDAATVMCGVCTFPFAVLHIVWIDAIHCTWHRKWCWETQRITAEPRSEPRHYQNHFIFWKTLYLINITVHPSATQKRTSQILTSLLIEKHICVGYSGIKFVLIENEWLLLGLLSHSFLVLCWFVHVKMLNETRVSPWQIIGHWNKYFKATLGLALDLASFQNEI